MYLIEIRNLQEYCSSLWAATVEQLWSFAVRCVLTTIRKHWVPWDSATVPRASRTRRRWMKKEAQRSCWYFYRQPISKSMTWSSNWRQESFPNPRWTVKQLVLNFYNSLNLKSNKSKTSKNKCNSTQLNSHKNKNHWKNTSSEWKVFFFKWTGKSNLMSSIWKIVPVHLKPSSSLCSQLISMLRGQLWTFSIFLTPPLLTEWRTLWMKTAKYL